MQSIIDLDKEQRLLVPRVDELCSTLTKLVADTEEFRRQHPDVGAEEAENIYLQLTELAFWAGDVRSELAEIADWVDDLRRERQELEDELASNRRERQELEDQLAVIQDADKKGDLEMGMVDLRLSRRELAVKVRKNRVLQAEAVDELATISREPEEVAAWAEDYRVQLTRLMGQVEGAPQ